MTARRRHKPSTPEQIALAKAQRQQQERANANKPENWGLAMDNLHLTVNSDVDGRKVGKTFHAKRTPWSERILRQGSPGLNAVNRLEEMIAASEGIRDGREDIGVRTGFGSRELVNGAMLAASDNIAQVLALISKRDRDLLLRLIYQAGIRTSGTPTWNLIVWMVTGENNKNAQGAVVRMAAENLAEAFYWLDSTGGWKK
jgi:hypothetical protein